MKTPFIVLHGRLGWVFLVGRGKARTPLQSSKHQASVAVIRAVAFNGIATCGVSFRA